MNGYDPTDYIYKIICFAERLGAMKLVDSFAKECLFSLERYKLKVFHGDMLIREFIFNKTFTIYIKIFYFEEIAENRECGFILETETIKHLPALFDEIEASDWDTTCLSWWYDTVEFL